MDPFAGSYVHQPGDRFIFKGSVTWPNAALPLLIGVGGQEATPDYYGVDPSWFAGSSWSRPVFDAEAEGLVEAELYEPQELVAELVDHGVDHSAIFDDDIHGAPRSGPWDMGAYEYDPTAPRPDAADGAHRGRKRNGPEFAEAIKQTPAAAWRARDKGQKLFEQAEEVHDRVGHRMRARVHGQISTLLAEGQPGKARTFLDSIRRNVLAVGLDQCLNELEWRVSIALSDLPPGKR